MVSRLGKLAFSSGDPGRECGGCAYLAREKRAFSVGKARPFHKDFGSWQLLSQLGSFFSHPSLVWTTNSILPVQLGIRELQYGGN